MESWRGRYQANPPNKRRDCGIPGELKVLVVGFRDERARESLYYPEKNIGKIEKKFIT